MSELLQNHPIQHRYVSVVSRAIVYSVRQEYKHKIFKTQNSIIKLVINEPVHEIAIGAVSSLFLYINAYSDRCLFSFLLDHYKTKLCSEVEQSR